MAFSSVLLFTRLCAVTLAYSEPSCTETPGPQFEFQQDGDYLIAGLFPVHESLGITRPVPELQDCNTEIFNKHGYHLMQAMRFALEEINSATSALLPGVKLGYEAYDICSESANILATFNIVSKQNVEHQNEQLTTETHNDPKTIAVIGPDTSTYAFTTASVMGYYLMPQISYESSNELLSNKRLYPSFFRTIPTDRYQVRAMLQLLSEFHWTWIAVLGSDEDYGTQGMQSLSELALKYGICVAYQATIPSYSEDTRAQMLQVIKGIVQTNVNVVVVFSSNRKASGFFSLVIEQNITDKVWIGSEDWSMSTLVSMLPKIKSIGSVMGISVKAAVMPGFAEFESLSIESENTKANEEPVCQSETFSEILACYQVCDQCRLLNSTDVPSLLETFDIQSSFNVYTAVYAVAHALHQLLGCDSEECQKKQVHPWQLLQQIKQVNISIHDAPLYFDNNGDPPTGYDIIAWDWVGDSVSYKVIGSYSPNPERLLINRDLINWNAKDNKTVPTSVCSAECWKGYKRVLTGAHVCCFNCEACPAGTYVDINDLFNCKPCEIHQWSLPESDACLNRTVEYLPWNDITSAVLIITSVMTLLLTVATAGLFLLNLNTPVVKSAGGKTCLLMLSSLACASCSVYGHFGVPTAVGCAFLRELFSFSFTICLSCVAVRSFQIVCIFKMSGKLPKAYEFWTKNNGPHVFILVTSAIGFFISLLRIVLDRPVPIENYSISPDKIVLECSGTQSVGSAMETGYVGLLSFLCFAFSYMGKDLPANYNEAKCVTFSLLLYLVSWLGFYTTYAVYKGKYTPAFNTVAVLASVLGILGGYFMPKCYIILLKPQLNTAAHFQNCIQMYTTKKSDH
ncbi:taste receptor type 1 member 1-like [Acipenser ruthenus]|uniref:taste receptor type 1 member 1-like n=1 Tax=Acipenser ruthenus TaxID=7906 RepID=UPI00145A45BE|nr:taste receptor type 1 member 1-like [Acipenser ruthenus]XP_058849005.1 taste receptor type 1 member 1-like [Acipenser ruthenus]